MIRPQPDNSLKEANKDLKRRDRIRHWLYTTKAGAEVLDEAVNRRLNERESVLVLCYSDGWIEVYAKRTVAVHIAVKLHATTPVSEQAAEDYLDTTLPKRFAPLYIPGNIRAQGPVQRITAEQELRRRDRLKWMKLFREMGGMA